MVAPIASPSGVRLDATVSAPGQSPRNGEFKSVLEASIQRVEQIRNNATQAVEQLITGESEELHSALLATQKAELAFELGMQIRNKIVQAYQEIMRMQI